MNPKQMIRLYKTNEKQIERLDKNLDKFRKVKEDEIQKAWSKNNDELRDLERKHNTIIEKIKDQKESGEDEIKEAQRQLYEHIESVNKIIYLLKVQQEIMHETNPFVDTTQNSELLESFDDGMMKMILSVHEINRPKNKYELYVLGYSRVGRSDGYLEGRTLKLPYAYGLSIGNRSHYNLAHIVKHFTTLEEVKAYHGKNSLQKIMKEFFTRYNAMKIEYQQTITQYKMSDFQDMINQEITKDLSRMGVLYNQNSVNENMARETQKVDRYLRLGIINQKFHDDVLVNHKENLDKELKRVLGLRSH